VKSTRTMHQTFTIEADNIAKRYNRQTLFQNLDFSVETGHSLALTGPNGSGKTTLLEIIATLRRPSAGSVRYLVGGIEIEKREILNVVGFQSPRSNPYSELSGLENIQFIGSDVDDTVIDDLLFQFGLYEHRNKQVKFYSSGMKQRLKLLLTILFHPPIIILDEPGMNLDSAGKNILFSYLESVRASRIILIATNEVSEADWCTVRINLE
jgi:heme exporter protein A